MLMKPNKCSRLSCSRYALQLLISSLTIMKHQSHALINRGIREGLNMVWDEFELFQTQQDPQGVGCVNITPTKTSRWGQNQLFGAIQVLCCRSPAPHCRCTTSFTKNAITFYSKLTFSDWTFLERLFRVLSNQVKNKPKDQKVKLLCYVFLSCQHSGFGQFEHLILFYDSYCIPFIEPHTYTQDQDNTNILTN